MEGHEFEVVLVGADAEMRTTGVGLGGHDCIGYEEVGGCGRGITHAR